MRGRDQGRLRIIAGKWRSRKLAFPDQNDLRPTPDRVRETLFNWLQTDLAGSRCLDLFAGSGALGFEAASRGAAEVVMLENRKWSGTKLNRRLLAVIFDANSQGLAGDLLKEIIKTSNQD